MACSRYERTHAAQPELSPHEALRIAGNSDASPEVTPPRGGSEPPRRAIRAVPARRALDWYADAMRLWKRGPATFCGMALIIVIANFALNLVPIVGVAAGQLLLPLVECGLLYASLAADRGDRPRLRHLVAVFAAPPRALAAVIGASLVIFGAEALVASAFGGFDLLRPGSNAESISGDALVATYAAGMVVSLPLTFVPFAALFDGAGLRAAFVQSGTAFARNATPLALYGALSFVLLMAGLVTSGIGLLLALPWSAAASYAAWKDVHAIA